MVGAVGIELKATLKARKFRTPDMPPRIAFNTVVFVEGVRT